MTDHTVELDAGDVGALISETLFTHRLHASMNHCLACRWRPTANEGSLADQHSGHVATVLSGRVATSLAADRAATAERIAQAIATSVTPGFGLNHDGSESSHAMAYVEGLRDAHDIAKEFARGEGR